jgi:hypothetical protein
MKMRIDQSEQDNSLIRDEQYVRHLNMKRVTLTCNLDEEHLLLLP